ncbi:MULTISPECIES: AMIN-like domain-containing (lipo)protein [Rhodococcus]|uniref:AMIN-like domain-containing (lipo)protein n=1 Tax=Rhodococcus TaxID=1827 RepID=UPI00132E9C8D|nr:MULTISPECIES: hypothetical protein [Rhodococcus]MCZ1075283.1 hypothetical protein [Rhodococcus sp. A5(2022)]QHG85277.1 hypothetical protein D1O33_24815 [Rhodococcus rhodochrous]QOH59655.1 hypothetical protein C6Y44_26660 [Rhodococcus rhodochrous]
MNPTTHIRIMLIAATTAMALTGCSAISDEVAPVPTPAVAAATATHTPGTVPVDTTDKTAPADTDAALTVTDIRTGTHEGFDRVVYELGGLGTPGWRVGYVDRAIEVGSGETVPVAGDAVLEVRISGSAYPFTSEITPYTGPFPVRGRAGGSAVEVTGTTIFEGATQSFIGLAAPGLPFAVYSLDDPARVVIDVAH